MLRKLGMVTLACGLVVACAAGSDSGAKSPAPPTGAGGATDAHPASWFTIGAARDDFKKSTQDLEAAASDCQVACKALASLERATNHLCAVAEPEECSDARVRVDRARRTIDAQCGGC